MSGDKNNNDGQADASVMKRAMVAYDYIRYTYTDLNGLSRHKLMPRRNAMPADGVGIYSGIIACGPLTEEYLPSRVEKMNFPNALLRPMEGTLRPVPWVSSKYKTGQVLCETFWLDGKVQEAHPRALARRQVARLDDMGYKLYSSFETEFMLLKKENLDPVFPTCDYCCTLSFRPFEELFMDFEQYMTAAGIDIECLHAEHAPGQFETILRPSYGVVSADQAFVLKQALKELADSKGFQANYMGKIFAEYSGSGCHYNFSLWDKKTDSNVFYNKDGIDGLSNSARWWIGGLTKHCRALCALFNPTVNCYRRLHEPWAPDFDDWNVDDRMVSFRVKNYSPSATYIENRVPSALCNPYIVMAATIAAGLDGVVNKIEPPSKGRDGSNRLPDTLSEALDVLEEDTVLCEALGSEFVEWFLGSKREIDCKILDGSKPKVHDEASLKAEFDEYARLC